MANLLACVMSPLGQRFESWGPRMTPQSFYAMSADFIKAAMDWGRRCGRILRWTGPVEQPGRSRRLLHHDVFPRLEACGRQRPMSANRGGDRHGISSHWGEQLFELDDSVDAGIGHQQAVRSPNKVGHREVV